MLSRAKNYILFVARDSIYAIARYMPSAVRPSVGHTGGSVKDSLS